MLDEHINFFEAVPVQQNLQPRAGSQFTFLMLVFDTFLAAAQPGVFFPAPQLLEFF